MLLAFISLSSLTCKKIQDNGNLPAATTAGKNTMGFLLDGEPWIAYSNDFKIQRTEAYWETGSLVFTGVKYSHSRIYFSLKDPKKGVFPLSGINRSNFELYSYNEHFTLDISDSANRLEITRFDNNIVSGKFSLAFKSPSNRVLKITSGRFDMEIYP